MGQDAQNEKVRKQPLQERSHRNIGFPEESGMQPIRAVKPAGQVLPTGLAGPENTGAIGTPRVSLLARSVQIPVHVR
jgi:hypothetical protein